MHQRLLKFHSLEVLKWYRVVLVGIVVLILMKIRQIVYLYLSAIGSDSRLFYPIVACWRPSNLLFMWTISCSGAVFATSSKYLQRWIVRENNRLLNLAATLTFKMWQFGLSQKIKVVDNWNTFIMAQTGNHLDIGWRIYDQNSTAISEFQITQIGLGLR